MPSRVSSMTLDAISGLHGPARMPCLKIVKLPHEVARRPSSEARNRSHSVQFGPMADRHGALLPLPPVCSEAPALIAYVPAGT
jgi:hypothetical protein